MIHPFPLRQYSSVVILSIAAWTGVFELEMQRGLALEPVLYSHHAGSHGIKLYAHLYVDGTKITRLYGNWYYLESLPAGRHEITVSLNTNNHETLIYNGQPIEATVVLNTP